LEGAEGIRAEPFEKFHRVLLADYIERNIA
jgi:hypothetical protein